MNNTTQATESIDILRGQNIQALAKLLIESGMTVFTTVYSSNSKPSYIHFSDGQNIGYAQECESGCAVRFSTVHRPCRECGTGFGLQSAHEGIVNPTIEDAKRAFITAPQWSLPSQRKGIVKYKSIEDYCSHSMNTIGQITFLTK